MPPEVTDDLRESGAIKDLDQEVGVRSGRAHRELEGEEVRR